MSPLLPASAASGIAATPLSLYIHVPFCAARCGYCDFNTYALSSMGTGALDNYVRAAHAEIALAKRELGDTAPPLRSVFFGGGTPTMLSGTQLGDLLADARDTFALTSSAEVTTEANPETLTPALLDTLLAAGFTRLSLGMQSSVEHVLATLQRRHTPGRALEAVRQAHAAGFTSVSLDLIYGTPGESMADWQASIEAALSVNPEHLSAYALGIEEGTPLGRQVASGELAAPDDDEMADKYLLANMLLEAAGLQNYEISNWSLPGFESVHNLAYWQSHNWWGIGPGAHSHVNGFRWWNHAAPAAWQQSLAATNVPIAGSETLTPQEQHEEQIMLALRTSSGLHLSQHPEIAPDQLAAIDPEFYTLTASNHLVLTPQGRLLANAVIRELL